MNRDNAKVIVLGLIATAFFVYFLDPILRFFGNVLLRVTASICHAYYDRVYAQAAHLESQDYGFTLLVIVLMMPLMFTLMLSLRLVRRTWKGASPEPTPEKPTFRKAILFLVFVILSMVVVTIDISANYTQLSLMSSFQQHMRIVEPYITDQEQKVLFSQWSLMETRQDYGRIYQRLTALAATNGVTLPKNRIYSPTTL